MRRKKHKHTRKTVSFYKISHGFREPFKVLLDGNFMHAMIEAGLPNLEEHIPKLLGAQCRLFTTRCVRQELKHMGQQTAAAASASRHFALHKCGHEAAPLPAADCIAAQVGTANATRWWVATQDKALQSTLGRIPGAPLIFASVNGLHLAEPLQRAKSGAASSAAAAQAVPAHELTSEALKELEELRPRDEGIKKFRRKGPKAPNPLAVKKKRTKAQQQRQQQQQQQEQQQEGQKKRKRKKSKAGGAAGHGDGAAAAAGH